MGAVLLLAHGSPDPRHRRDVEFLAVQLGEPALQVAVAYLDHHGPTAAQAAAGLVEAGGSGLPVLVVPLFTAAAYHVTNDVPAAMDEVGRAGADPVQLDPPLPGDPELVAAAVRSASGPAAGTTVLFAAGSSSPEAIGRLQEQVGQLAGRTGIPIEAAFLGGGPNLETVLAQRRAAGDLGGVRVVPFVMADGVLRDRMVLRCQRAGVRLQPGTLCRSAAMVELLRSRVLR